MNIKINPLDQLFSDFIRTRDNWQCQRCKDKGRNSFFKPPLRIIKKTNKYHERHRPSTGLHNMHCFSRGNQSTRFDEKNGIAGCYGCHSFLDSHPLEKHDFFKDKIGEKAFKDLKLKSNTSAKIDRQKIKEHYQLKLKKLL